MAAGTDRPTSPRLLLLGLDGVPGELLFDRFLPKMPHVRALVERGTRATLRTTDPPISVPAWPVMFTGVDPGTLGLYGFRHRRPGTYTDMFLPGSKDVPVPTLWEMLSARGRRVAVVGMPLGFPPPAVNGVYVGDFLTPSDAAPTTYPASLRAELEARFGPYVFDVTFRSEQRERLAEDLFTMTRRRFDVAEYLLQREPWDVFAFHEIGTDRLHHAFWKHFDATHPEFTPGGPHERIAEEYYAMLDEGIGRLLAHTDERTNVVLVSDHGSMAMRACFCINQWLADAGYLALNAPPSRPGLPLEKADVDWRRTVAWGAGGYYARIFFNLRGREPNGTVGLADLSRVRSTLVQQLGQIEGPDGRPMAVRVLDPREIYATVRGEAPDLIVYFDELRVRAAGTLGHPGLFLAHNDTGPDDAVHSFDGVWLAAGPGIAEDHQLPPLSILDVAPSLLELLGEPVPPHIQGRSFADRLEPTERSAPGSPTAAKTPAPAAGT